MPYRINNTSAMSSISFSTSAGGGFYGVSAVNTIQSEILQTIESGSMCGAPVKMCNICNMGREVIFFMTSAGLTPGQGVLSYK